MSYQVQLEIFEGPLDLLLHLIKENEIDIYDIPMGYLTDQYLKYMKQFEEWNLDISTEFVLMAATLLEIKSRMLLPVRKQNPDPENEDKTEEDPRTELVEQLIEYRLYKEAAEQFRQLETVTSKIFYKPPDDFTAFFEERPHQNLTGEMLHKTLDHMLRQHLKKIAKKRIGEVYREHITVEEAMKEISDRINFCKKTTFSEVLGTVSSLEKLITFFLALLELIRQKKLFAEQSSDYQEIYLTRVDSH